MYKVLIADDEPYIRNGLRDTIEWDSLGLEFAGDAANGSEALKLIKERKPQILITDIKMPVMDGLRLIKEIQDLKLKIKVIVLSGYSDYEYLKEAINYRVESYLLKPIDHDELLSLLTNTVNNIENDLVFEAHQQEGIKALRANILNRLINNTISIKEYKEKASLLNIDLQGNEFYAVALMLYDNSIGSHLSPDQFHALYDANAICEEILNTKNCGVVFQDNNGLLVLILDNSKFILTKDSIKEQIEKLINGIQKEINLPVIAGIGSKVNSLEKIFESYNRALNCLDYALLIGDYKIINDSDLKLKRIDPKQEININFELMEDYIKLDKKQELFIYIENIFSTLSAISDLLVEDIRNFSMQIVIFIISFLRNIKGDIFYLKNILNFSYIDVLSFKKISDFESWIKLFCLNAINFISENVEKLMPKIVKETLDYIKNNYFSGLSLKLIAYNNHVNASYLGQIFKKEVGQTFVDYVNKFRIKKAKELLANTHMKVNEIAIKVGFTDPHYFLKIFKKYTHLRPSEIKNQ
jgi:two-component system response regulator YesN